MVLVTALWAQVPVQSAPTVAGVEVRLPAEAEPHVVSKVSQLISVRKGHVFSRKAISRSIESLFASGKFADIEVLTEEREPGQSVELIFVLTLQHKIGSLFVDGAAELARADVLTAAGLKEGDEYWPERALAAAEKVRAMYRKRGFRQAKVHIDEQALETGLSVGLAIEEGSPSLIRALSISGETGVSGTEVLRALGVSAGDVLDLARLDQGIEAVRAMYRTQRYYRARVSAPQLGEDGGVRIEVDSGPQYRFTFRGNRSFSDGALTSVLGFSGEETLDSTVTDRLAARLSRFYRFRGFLNVRVMASDVRRGKEAALLFAIEEGEWVRVTDVEFLGARQLSSTSLLEVLEQWMESAAPQASVESRADAPAPPWATVFDGPTWEEAARAMTALYRSKGFLRAKVVFEGLDLVGRQARGRFVVAEGPQARIQSLEVTGLPVEFESALLQSDRKDKPLNGEDLSALEQGLTRELGRKGYLYAVVVGSYTLDEEGQRARVLLSVNSGPQVKVRAILAVGAVRTSEALILEQATMKEGQPLDVDSLYDTQAKLTALGIFRSVQVEMLSPERPEPLKTVLLKVRERSLFAGEYFLGYFFADGFRGGVEGSVANIGGRAITLTGRLQGNLFFTSYLALSRQVDLAQMELWKQMGFRANLSLEARSVLPASIGFHFDVIGERVFRPQQQFNFSRVAGLPTLSWARSFQVPQVPWLSPKLSLALQYELEWSSVARVGNALTLVPPTSLVDQARLRFNFGEFVLQSIRLTPTLDLRDNPLNPTRGALLQGTVELTGALSANKETFGSETPEPVKVDFLKMSALATGYIPLAPRWVLALSARTGRILHLQEGASTPPVRRFFLGGATSVRGFNEDQLIAEDLRAQYRREVADCQSLASKDGCSSAAKTIAAGRQVPSQGGELFAVFKVELRMPLLKSIDWGVFFEAGNLWLTMPQALGPFRPVAGLGMRYVTVIGAIALDVGANLTPDVVVNEPLVVLHFNIGLF